MSEIDPAVFASAAADKAVALEGRLSRLEGSVHASTAAVERLTQTMELQNSRITKLEFWREREMAALAVATFVSPMLFYTATRLLGN